MKSKIIPGTKPGVQHKDTVNISGQAPPANSSMGSGKGAGAMRKPGALLKKNEFTLIIVGAFVVTLVVFFLFFRNGGSQSGESQSESQGIVRVPLAPSANAGPQDAALEKRMSDLELAVGRLEVAGMSAAPVTGGGESGGNLSAVEARIGRIETALTMKVDALIKRVDQLEGRLARVKKDLAEQSVKRLPPSPAKVAQSAPVKTPAPPEKTAMKKKAAPEKKAEKPSLFHTVQKGETLWSISQKYKTTVVAIRKLNNLSPEDKIYPGNTILVR